MENPATLIFYESPHRLEAVLKDMEEIWGGHRSITAVRELTKIHEEVVRGTLEEVTRHFKENRPRGEFCLITAGYITETGETETDMNRIDKEVKELIAQGIEKKEAFKMKASEYKLKKSDIYKYYHLHNLTDM